MELSVSLPGTRLKTRKRRRKSTSNLNEDFFNIRCHLNHYFSCRDRFRVVVQPDTADVGLAYSACGILHVDDPLSRVFYRPDGFPSRKEARLVDQRSLCDRRRRQLDLSLPGDPRDIRSWTAARARVEHEFELAWIAHPAYAGWIPGVWAFSCACSKARRAMAKRPNSNGRSKPVWQPSSLP